MANTDLNAVLKSAVEWAIAALEKSRPNNDVSSKAYYHRALADCRRALALANIEDLAAEALPQPVFREGNRERDGGNDWGSARQSAAENAFFDAVKKILPPDEFEELEAYRLKFITEDAVTEAMRRIRPPLGDKYEKAAKAEGWRLDADGAFRHPDEVLQDCDNAPASFWYDGDWRKLCEEAAIAVESDVQTLADEAADSKSEEEMIAALSYAGFIVRERDPRVNTDHQGKWMVIESDWEEHDLPTKDASNGPRCIVGDDCAAIVREAFKEWA
jgi:hypothetical protein